MHPQTVSSNPPCPICKTETDADDAVAQRKNACSGGALPRAHRSRSLASVRAWRSSAGRARPLRCPLVPRPRPSSGTKRQRWPPVVEEEAAAAAAVWKRRWRPAEAPRRPYYLRSAPPDAGERKTRRNPAAGSVRWGKEEEEVAIHYREVASPSSFAPAPAPSLRSRTPRWISAGC
jgi:hypothetical protein